jgi:hypothetical protein
MPVQPDDDIIIAERALGTSTANIGRLLGKGKNSVAGRINRLKRLGLITEVLPSPIHRPGDPAPYPRAAPPRLPVQADVPPPSVVCSPVISSGQIVTPALSPPPLSGQCRFPLWADSERPNHAYCRKPARLGSSYCPACRAVCYAREPRQHWAAS